MSSGPPSMSGHLRPAREPKLARIGRQGIFLGVGRCSTARLACRGVVARARAQSARQISGGRAVNSNLLEADSDEDEQSESRAGASPWATTGKVGRRRTPSEGDPAEATELIFNLYNRGDGWGEEFIPHLTVEKRAIKPKPRGAAEAWEEGSIERVLVNEGVPEDLVDQALARVIAWRITPAGRTLVDKRRRTRVKLNLPEVLDFLEACGIARGPRGIGAVLTRFPHVLLCKPSAHDRWDRKVLELAAYVFQHGTSFVPDSPPHRPLHAFAKRVRLLRQQGTLPEERVLILEGIAFEWGNDLAITPDWETHFDFALEFLLHGQAHGGLPAPAPTGESRWKVTAWRQNGRAVCTRRRLAAWVLQQRHLYHANLLPADAVQRLEAIDFAWVEPGASDADQAWLAAFGELAHVADRARASSRATPRRLKPKVAAAAAAGDGDSDDESCDRQSRGSDGDREMVAAELPQLPLSTLQAAPMPARVCLWLERQRALWRCNRLPALRSQLFYAAGIDLSSYSTEQWRVVAHGATAVLNHCYVPLLPAPSDQPASQEGGAPPSDNVPPPAVSLSAVRRWVQTQRRLSLESRLSAAQREYLSALGLGWVLQQHSDDADWDSTYSQVVAQVAAMGMDVGLAHSQPDDAASEHRDTPALAGAALLDRLLSSAAASTSSWLSDAQPARRHTGSALAERALQPLSLRASSGVLEPVLPVPAFACAAGGGGGGGGGAPRQAALWAKGAEAALELGSRGGGRWDSQPREGPGALEDWLQVQLGLDALDALPPRRRERVERLRAHVLRGGGVTGEAAGGAGSPPGGGIGRSGVWGVDFVRQSRGGAAADARRVWGLRMAALMQFRRQHGHVDVPRGPPYDALHAWLEEQRQDPALRPLLMSQLRAVGVRMPHAARAFED